MESWVCIQYFTFNIYWLLQLIAFVLYFLGLIKWTKSVDTLQLFNWLTDETKQYFTTSCY